MTRWPLIGLGLFLTACASEPQVVVRPEIPADLFKPEPRPECEIATLKDAGICIVDYDETLGRANGKIVATSEIING